MKEELENKISTVFDTISHSKKKMSFDNEMENRVKPKLLRWKT